VERGLGELPLASPGFALVGKEAITDQQADAVIEDVGFAVILVPFVKDVLDGVGVCEHVTMEAGDDAEADVIAVVLPGLGV
jgi:hypothetical protein